MTLLVLLSGRPAVGKLTIARQVASSTGLRLFHNHLCVDMLLAVFEFGSPAFVELRHQTWLSVFRHAVAERVPGLLFTFNPENTVSQQFVDELRALFTAPGNALLVVELTAPEHVIEARLAAASRVGFKLTDVELYRKLRDQGAFDRPVMPAAALTVDTSERDPAASAELIARLVAQHQRQQTEASPPPSSSSS
jgi:predicted kinase